MGTTVSTPKFSSVTPEAWQPKPCLILLVPHDGIRPHFALRDRRFVYSHHRTNSLFWGYRAYVRYTKPFCNQCVDKRLIVYRKHHRCWRFRGRGAVFSRDMRRFDRRLPSTRIEKDAAP